MTSHSLPLHFWHNVQVIEMAAIILMLHCRKADSPPLPQDPACGIDKKTAGKTLPRADWVVTPDSQQAVPHGCQTQLVQRFKLGSINRLPTEHTTPQYKKISASHRSNVIRATGRPRNQPSN